MELETKLLMTFSTTAGRKVSLFITDPREDINETEIKSAMELIVSKIVQTETTEYDLQVS